MKIRFATLASLGMVAFLQVPNVAGQNRPEVEIVLGGLQTNESNDPIPPSPLQSPFGIDFDPAGNMYIVELEGGRVHRLDPRGNFETISGDGSKSYRGDGGPPKSATFNGMHNVAVTSNGDVYIADSWNHCIRKIDAIKGIISTVAGNGKAGFSGDGGPAVNATFDYVMCITLNPADDKIYIADLKNRRIRMVDLASGIVTTVAGNGDRGVPTDGALATGSPLVDPRAVTVDSKGNIYILERGGNALRRVKPDGTIWTVAGTGTKGDRDGPALNAQLNSPKHLCIDANDNVIIADDQNASIRLFNSEAKTLTTILGHGKSTPSLYLKRPHAVCCENGFLYVVDTGNNRILKLEHPTN